MKKFLLRSTQLAAAAIFLFSCTEARDWSKVKETVKHTEQELTNQAAWFGQVVGDLEKARKEAEKVVDELETTCPENTRDIEFLKGFADELAAALKILEAPGGKIEYLGEVLDAVTDEMNELLMTFIGLPEAAELRLAVEQAISSLNPVLEELAIRADNLLSMVQSVHLIPESEDGRIVMDRKFFTEDEIDTLDTLRMKCRVLPASAAQALADDPRSLFLYAQATLKNGGPLPTEFVDFGSYSGDWFKIIPVREVRHLGDGILDLKTYNTDIEADGTLRARMDSLEMEFMEYASIFESLTVSEEAISEERLKKISDLFIEVYRLQDSVQRLIPLEDFWGMFHIDPLTALPFNNVTMQLHVRQGAGDILSDCAEIRVMTKREE